MLPALPPPASQGKARSALLVVPIVEEPAAAPAVEAGRNPAGGKAVLRTTAAGPAVADTPAAVDRRAVVADRPAAVDSRAAVAAGDTPAAAADRLVAGGNKVAAHRRAVGWVRIDQDKDSAAQRALLDLLATAAQPWSVPNYV